MHYVIRLAQFVWLLPVTVLFWISHILPMWLIFRDLVWCGWAEFCVAEFTLRKALTPWYGALWGAWYGMGGPCVFVRRELIGTPETQTLRVHELEHVRQQFRWGPLFYPAYVGSSIFLWLFSQRHPYYDNPFERGARQAAGQQVTDAMRNARDRWPWW